MHAYPLNHLSNLHDGGGGILCKIFWRLIIPRLPSLYLDNCVSFFSVLQRKQRRDHDFARTRLALIDYAFAGNNDWSLCSAAIFLAVAVNTHMHADHITGTGRLKCLLPGCKSMISRSSGAEADVLLEPYDQVQFGRHQLRALPTPGHTEGEVSLHRLASILFRSKRISENSCRISEFLDKSI